MTDGAKIDTAQLNCSTQTCFVLCYKRLSNVTAPSSMAGWDWFICLSCLRALARGLAPRPEEEALLNETSRSNEGWESCRFTASSAPLMRTWFVFVNNSLFMYTISFQTMFPQIMETSGFTQPPYLPCVRLPLTTLRQATVTPECIFESLTVTSFTIPSPRPHLIS